VSAAGIIEPIDALEDEVIPIKNVWITTPRLNKQTIWQSTPSKSGSASNLEPRRSRTQMSGYVLWGANICSFGPVMPIHVVFTLRKRGT